MVDRIDRGTEVAGCPQDVASSDADASGVDLIAGGGEVTGDDSTGVRETGDTEGLRERGDVSERVVPQLVETGLRIAEANRE